LAKLPEVALDFAKPVIEPFASLFKPLISPTVNPAIVNPLVNPAIVNPLVNPAIVNPLVNPAIVNPLVNPAIVNPLVNPAIVNPLVNPAIVNPIVNQPLIQIPGLTVPTPGGQTNAAQASQNIITINISDVHLSGDKTSLQKFGSVTVDAVEKALEKIIRKQAIATGW